MRKVCLSLNGITAIVRGDRVVCAVDARGRQVRATIHDLAEAEQKPTNRAWITK